MEGCVEIINGEFSDIIKDPFDSEVEPAAVELYQSRINTFQLPTRGEPLQVGDLPYDFALKNASGSTVQLGDFHWTASADQLQGHLMRSLRH